MAGSREEPEAAKARVREKGEEEARAAELDRIDARLERLSAQRRALRKAIGQFGENFDVRV